MSFKRYFLNRSVFYGFIFGICFFLLPRTYSYSQQGNYKNQTEKEIYEALYFLLELDRQKQKLKEKGREGEDSKQRESEKLNGEDFSSFSESGLREGEDSEQVEWGKSKEAFSSLEEDSPVRKENLEEIKIDRFEKKANLKWKFLIGLKDSSYLKSLFEKEEELRSWIEKTPEPLYLSIQLNNMDLLKFFSEKVNVQLPYRSLDISPLHTAIISQNIEAVEFLLKHPNIDLKATSSFSENLFHYVFFGSASQKKLKIFDLLFHEDHFPKISSLLNAADNSNETALDFALREEKKKFYEGLIEKLLEQGAMSFKLLSGSEKAAELLQMLKTAREKSDHNKLRKLMQAEMKNIVRDLIARRKKREGEERNQVCLQALRGLP